MSALAALPARADTDAAGPTVGRLAYQLLALAEAKRVGLPYPLVDAVMSVESGYRADRVGDVGEIGLMQVRPTTAAMLGFHGTAADLADPAINIHYGTAYLGEAWRLAGGNVCRALMKYRAGHGNETMTPLSVTYCQRARAHLASVGSPLAATITAVDLVATLPTGPGASAGGESLRVNGRPKKGAAFWTAFEARVRRINAHLEAKWKRVASR